MDNKITTIRVTEDTKKRLQKVKKYPRETNEEVLVELIKNHLSKKEA